MSFNDFIDKHKLKNKATSNIKIQQVLSSLSLNDVGINFGDEPFLGDMRIINVHPSKGTHWELFVHESFYASYGCSPPQKLSKFNIK